MQRCVFWRTVRARAAFTMLRALMKSNIRSAAKLTGCRCISSVQRACTIHSRDPLFLRGNCIAPKALRYSCAFGGCRHSAPGRRTISCRRGDRHVVSPGSETCLQPIFRQIRRQRTNLLGVANTFSRSPRISGELPPHVLHWLSQSTRRALSGPIDSHRAHHYLKHITTSWSYHGSSTAMLRVASSHIRYSQIFGRGVIARRGIPVAI